MTGSALMAQLADIVRTVAGEEMTSAAVAVRLGVSKRTAQRIPRAVLPYTESPGGALRKGHRKYRREDVEAYAATYLGRGTNATQPRHKAQGT